MKKLIISFINKLPYVRGLYAEVENFKKHSWVPVGHFYSPIVSMEEIKKKESEIWEKKEIKDIDFNTDYQIKLLNQLSVYYKEQPFREERSGSTRYQFKNTYFCHTDALILYSLIRHFKPKQIIEVGSGFSSAVMLDANEQFMSKDVQLTFIEPYPDRLNQLISETDKGSVNVVESFIQVVNIEIFKNLNAGDILFIDSTHVVKTGSDVHYILFEVLPVLKTGVLIHFHDVLDGFEYPKEWVFGGRNWNEDYFLRAFLMHNNKYEIIQFNNYLHKNFDEVYKDMPLCYKDFGGSLWLSKK